MTLVMTAADWLQLALHFLFLSLFTVGGAIVVAPDMHRFIVTEREWMSSSDFAQAITVAQISPGPNVLFVAVLGWQIGLSAGGGLGNGWVGPLMGLAGALICLLSLLLPTSLMTYVATRWAHRHQSRRVVKSFKAGMAPIVVGLLIATAWVLASSTGVETSTWPRLAVALASAWLMIKTRLHLLWIMAMAALIGALGFIP